jgi:hypothetical protein
MKVLPQQAKSVQTSIHPHMTMEEEQHYPEEGGLSQSHKTITEVLKDLQPIRDLAKNWDIDIATWYGIEICCVDNSTHSHTHTGVLLLIYIFLTLSFALFSHQSIHIKSWGIFTRTRTNSRGRRTTSNKQ